MKCTVSQAWETKQRESRAGIAVSGWMIVLLASLLTALLWAAMLFAVFWASGTPIVLHWLAGVLAFIFCATWLMLNVLRMGAGCYPHANAAPIPRRLDR